MLTSFLLLLSLVFSSASAEEARVNQQSITVNGTVTDATGEALPGVAIQVKGSETGTVSNINGQYSIKVPSTTSVLVFSFVGYTPVEEIVGNRRTIDITLRENSRQLDEVVVTALGIVKKEKSLTYSTQVVNGDELTRAKDPNLINTLAGKTAGVSILSSAAGLGGSVKVNIRGSRSVSGNNQPLYVVDGIPINSSSNDQTATSIGGTNDSGNRDGGDGISNLNPDDIESVNILKGPAASALYGNSAANGVVVITTKKGKVGRTEITFNSNTTWENAVHGRPEFQNSYGGTTTSWGKDTSGKYIRVDGSPDYLDMFFKTGFTTINSLSLTTGSEGMQFYLSYANTSATGTVDNSSLGKHNFNFRQTANFFDKRLTTDANINMMYQQVKNRPSPGGFYMNPLVGLYRFPRGGVSGGESMAYYKENYKYYDPERNMYLQNWYNSVDGGWEQNPFWLTNMQPGEDIRYRVIANLSLSFKINDHFDIKARGNADFIANNYEMKMYAGTSPALTGSSNGNNGRYINNQDNSLDLYGDAMLTYHQTFGDFDVNATLGGAIKDARWRSSGVDSYPDGLYNPNLFSINNVIGGSPSLGKGHSQEQSVFFSAQAGFREQLYLDITGRNDWVSSLAGTKYADRGFFYPSVGLTWLLNETLKLPEWITLGKVRGAWSKVGNGLPQYIANPLNTVGRGGTINYNTTAPFSELKPEMTTAIEVGTEWRFWGSRLEFDFTYYKSNTRDQLFTLSAPSGSQYTTYYVNAGNVQNQGVEIVLSGSPVMNNDFTWKTGVNFSTNKNKVVKLHPELGYFQLSGGTSNSYALRLEVGGSFGDIYGRAFQRDESGKILYDDKGLPYPDSSDLKKIGNNAPDFNLGWNNSFSYKGFNLYFLIDGRFGGKVLSLTEAELDKQGVSKRTGADRDRGYVDFDGKQISDVEGFYNVVGGRDGVTEHYIYDATNIRLRELSLGYTFPKKLLANTKVIKGASLSLVGRNLFFLTNKAPYDPDGTLSVGNGLQGIHAFGMPSSRSFGFNLKVNF
ncbi:MAG: SusC/RagA family TonB-linked outer membrane protein [Mediterranea sp.]|jgi:TonB-linked SusC/RagA family outer membrane protein|nr:SusC/RagA family TonB-linked outer membrane protein [Mediterranea sp.]